MPFIEFKYQIPKIDMSSAKLRGTISSTLLNVAKNMKKDLEATTETWQEHDPFFWSTTQYRGGDVRVTIGTDDEVWNYLNKGTEKRWAVMSPDFQAKTTKRRFSSRAGQGGAVLRGKGIMTKLKMSARKGIEARDWFGRLRDDYDDVIAGQLRVRIFDLIKSSIKVVKGP